MSIGEKIFNLYLTKKEHKEIMDSAYKENKSMQTYIKQAVENENKKVNRKEK